MIYFTLLLIGIGLSMDTFSLSILYGTIGLNKNKIILLSLIVGIFHFFMPIIGNCIGLLIFNKIFADLGIIIGIIFIIIAIQMFFQKQVLIDLTKNYSLFLFALTVSLDSLSVGVGLRAITSNIFVAALIFCVVSMLFTYVGLMFGKFLNNEIGNFATKLGSVILFCIGIYYIFLRH